MADGEAAPCEKTEVEVGDGIAVDTAPCSDRAGEDSKRGREDDESEVNSEKRVKLSAADGESAANPPVSVGPKTFTSSVAMFDYFYKLLHTWPPKVDLNKYEHMMLLELVKKGHSEPDKKIGSGVKVFQVRFHPQYKSRCFFLVREDESADDFSFRKCVDRLIPLPENMQVQQDANRALQGRRGRGGGRGRGRGRSHGK
ncbi:hypothetical protein M569_10774 [Genlisea aurea]|uniref:Uncharacterized protein n=1 Tax=Genlisea aurea TaxID=192259 RepID=S8DVR3_9LAMI|nr:hypothetical protein M569_10774 [Genlisea aurea]